MDPRLRPLRSGTSGEHAAHVVGVAGHDLPLPRVSVPLLPGDPDSEVDLQLALNSIYDLLGYGLALDYASLLPIAPSLERQGTQGLAR